MKKLSLYVVALLMFFGITAHAFTGVQVKLYGDTSGDITLSVSNLNALVALLGSMDDISDLPANTSVDMEVTYNNYRNQGALMTGAFNLNLSTNSMALVNLRMSGSMNYGVYSVVFNNMSYTENTDGDLICSGGGLTLDGSYISCQDLGIDPFTLLLILTM